MYNNVAAHPCTAPGYRESSTLFHVPARDGPNHDSAYYTTIHDACCVLTGENESFLSTTRERDTRVEPDQHGLIPAGIYYLHVLQEGVTDFAIVGSFRSWAFPHDQVPPHWLRAAQDEQLLAQHERVDASSALISETCRITGKRLAPNRSHIIPEFEKQWFTSNEMDEYGLSSGKSGSRVADSAVNKIGLKSDAHIVWDSYKFSIVPRKLPDGTWAWFTQMLVEDEEVEEDYHRKRLRPLIGRPPQHLYARFAFDLFPRLINFLEARSGVVSQLKSVVPIFRTVIVRGIFMASRPFCGTRAPASSLILGKCEAFSCAKDAVLYAVRGTNDQASWLSLSPQRSVDSAVRGIVRRVKRRSRGSLERPWSELQSIRAQYGEEYWAYLCGHGDGDRGRKRQREGG